MEKIKIFQKYFPQLFYSTFRSFSPKLSSWTIFITENFLKNSLKVF